MASQTQGIQQLLAAEKKAAEKVKMIFCVQSVFGYIVIRSNGTYLLFGRCSVLLTIKSGLHVRGTLVIN